MSDLVRIHVASDSADDGISVIEQVARCGDSLPLHIHRTEDELFHVVEGELSFRRGSERHSVAAGEFSWCRKSPTASS